MHDAYVLKYGESDDVKLFPGSLALWEDDQMETGEMPKRFLEAYGLAEELFQAENDKVVGIDTGFRGTAGYFLRKAISKQYGQTYEEIKQKIPIKLISSIYTKESRVPHLWNLIIHLVSMIPTFSLKFRKSLESRSNPTSQNTMATIGLHIDLLCLCNYFLDFMGLTTR